MSLMQSLLVLGYLVHCVSDTALECTEGVGSDVEFSKNQQVSTKHENHEFKKQKQLDKYLQA